MKKEISTFFVWLRSGFCFVTAWLTLLVAAYCLIKGAASISVSTLLYLIVYAFGGALLFCLWFSPFPFKKMSFIRRLSGFFAVFIPLEFAYFYAIGLFTKSGTMLYNVLIFTGIVLAFYLTCILLDKFYYSKKGKEYNESLKRYQNKRMEKKNDEQ